MSRTCFEEGLHAHKGSPRWYVGQGCILGSCLRAKKDPEWCTVRVCAKLVPCMCVCACRVGWNDADVQRRPPCGCVFATNGARGRHVDAPGGQGTNGEHRGSGQPKYRVNERIVRLKGAAERTQVRVSHLYWCGHARGSSKCMAMVLREERCDTRVWDGLDGTAGERRPGGCIRQV